mmetsp:Transcript_13745/g.19359  ORF Transcript_13745/g.19359 Transcript_13745/m.19359 type:complete len:223 (-) Transcript_13745:447-1115(-)
MLAIISPGLSKTCAMTLPCSLIRASDTDGNTDAMVFGKLYATFSVPSPSVQRSSSCVFSLQRKKTSDCLKVLCVENVAKSVYLSASPSVVRLTQSPISLTSQELFLLPFTYVRWSLINPRTSSSTYTLFSPLPLPVLLSASSRTQRGGKASVEVIPKLLDLSWPSERLLWGNVELCFCSSPAFIDIFATSRRRMTLTKKSHKSNIHASSIVKSISCKATAIY